jgi:hypothetical protein
MRASAAVPVSDHAYGLFDESDASMPVDTADFSNGLIVTMSVGATIHTGIDRGAVTVTVELLTAAPETIDAGPWDDIVEANIDVRRGELRVRPIEPHVHLPALPALNIQGPGSYRLRAHTHGRDLEHDQVSAEATERYLLTIWPAQRQPDLIIRATDRCGYGLRLAHLANVAARRDSTPAPEPARHEGQSVVSAQAMKDRLARFQQDHPRGPR